MWLSLRGGKNLYYSNYQPYWHSIFSIVSLFLSFRDDWSLPFSNLATPPSFLKILQPPFRSQNPATLLPFSKSYNPPSFLKILQPPPVLKILRPPFPPQNPATSPFPRVLLLQFLQDVPFFLFPFYLLFLHCQLGASSFGETLEQFLTRLKNKYHWTDQGRLEALMKELRKRRITTVRTLREIWDDINSELPLSIGIKKTLEKEFKRM